MSSILQTYLLMDSNRSADDLWRNTLSQIETVFGRLEYLSSLRNPHTGRYEHYGLEQRFGSEKSDLTLRGSHESIFHDWVAFSLETQKSEILYYLDGRDEQARDIVNTWLGVRPFATWVPATAKSVERTLFLSDLDAVLELIRRELGVAAPNPDS